MRLLTVFLFAASLAVSARPAAQTISFSGRDVPLEKVFSAIKKQTGFFVFSTKKTLDGSRPVTVTVHDLPLAEFLRIVLKDQPLSFSLDGKTITLFRKKKPAAAVSSDALLPALPRIMEISGIVTDEKNEPLAGVSVVEKGTTNGVTTDAYGHFTIKVNEGAKLVFSFVGMQNKEVALRGNKTLKVMMESAKKEMDNVVVSGYFNRSKQTFTGAATSFTGEELRTVTNENVLSALTVLDPSFKLIESNLNGSDPNLTPEFEIRGSASIKSNLEERYKGNPNIPLFILDGFEVSLEQIYDLDPQRIKDATILKDAAALAIFGSRGANGVVVITTNPPLPGKLRVTYNASVNFEMADLSDYHLLNAADKLEYEKLAGIYTPNSYVYIGERYQEIYNERLKLVQQGTNTDWLKKPVKSVGIDTKQSISLEGGDNTFRYGVDLNYNPTQGVMKGSGRNRKGINIRLNYNYKNLRFSNQLSFNNVQVENSPYGSFSTYAYLNPYYSPVDDDGNIKKVLFRLESVTSPVVTISNPLYNTTINTKNTSSYDNFVNNFAIEWNVNSEIKLNSSFSINKQTQVADIFKPADHTDFINSTVKGSYFKSTNQTLAYEGNAGVRYARAVERHLLVVNANYNLRQVAYDLYSVTASGFPNDQMDHISSGLEYLEGTSPDGYESTSRLMGVLGNVNYSYDNRFLADFALRYDGSSQFGSDKKWGRFWSAGLGWNLHHEKFLGNQSFINILKVRGSVGFTGSQNFYPYQAELTYKYISGVTYDDYFGAVASAYGNTDLRWQKTLKKNIGVDFELMKSKITGYFNYYSDISQDVLVDVTLPPSLGFNTYKANLGEVQNRGYEFSLRATLLANQNKKRYINVFGSAIKNKNTLKKISNALRAYNDKVDESDNSKPSVRYVEGQSINTVWVVKSLGIDPATGEEVFLDKSGKRTNVWNSADYIPYRTTDPKMEGTFGANLGEKGFQLNLYFRYRLGGYLYNSTLVDRVENVNPNQNVDSRVFEQRWKQPGDIAYFKGISNTSVTRPTSRFVETDNLVELRSVNLSYVFSDQPFLNKMGAERLRLTAFMNDVFRISSVKTERGIDYPFARHFAFGVQVIF